MTPNVWRTRLIVVGCVLLALVGAFSAGRFSAPLKVEEKLIHDKGETIYVKGETVYVKAEAKIVWRDRVILKDGTVTEHEIEKTDTKEDAKISTSASATLTDHVETVKTVTLRPNWRVSALVGASWRAPLLPIAGPLVLGVAAEYRIVGGLSAGLWVNTGGVAGVSVSFEF